MLFRGHFWRRGQDDKVDSNGVRAGNMTGVDGHHARCLAWKQKGGGSDYLLDKVDQRSFC